MHQEPTMHDPTSKSQSLPILQAKGKKIEFSVNMSVFYGKILFQQCIAVGMSRDGELIF